MNVALRLGLLVLLGLGAALVLQQDATPPPVGEAPAPPAAPAQAGTDTAPVAGLPELAGPGRYAVIAERTLFMPNRRPPEEQVRPATPTANETVAAPPAPPDYTVSAIVREGDRWLALVRPTGGDKEAREVEVGGDIEGWEITGITADRVRLRSGPRIADLPLRPPAAGR